MSAEAVTIGPRNEVLSVLCTCQCIRFESLTLKMKVNDVDDFNDIGRLVNLHMSAKIGASRFSHFFVVKYSKFCDILCT